MPDCNFEIERISATCLQRAEGLICLHDRRVQPPSGDGKSHITMTPEEAIHVGTALISLATEDNQGPICLGGKAEPK